MTIEDFKNANHVYKDTLNCSYIDSAGKSKGAQYNHIGAFAVTTSIDFFVKKNNFRIVSKSNVSIINLAHKNYYFFFAIEGNTKVQITYPYVK